MTRRRVVEMIRFDGDDDKPGVPQQPTRVYTVRPDARRDIRRDLESNGLRAVVEVGASVMQRYREEQRTRRAEQRRGAR